MSDVAKEVKEMNSSKKENVLCFFVDVILFVVFFCDGLSVLNFFVGVFLFVVF